MPMETIAHPLFFLAFCPPKTQAVCMHASAYLLHYYYYYYAAFNAPCVGRKADELQARGHVDLRVAVSVIKRFKFLFESIGSDVQVASDDVRYTIPDVWSTVGETALSKTGSHPRNFKQVATGGPKLS